MSRFAAIAASLLLGLGVAMAQNAGTGANPAPSTQGMSTGATPSGPNQQAVPNPNSTSGTNVTQTEQGPTNVNRSQAGAPNSSDMNSVDQANASQMDSRFNANPDLKNVTAMVKGDKVSLNGQVQGKDQDKEARDVVKSVLPGAKIKDHLQTQGNMANQTEGAGGGGKVKKGKNSASAESGNPK